MIFEQFALSLQAMQYFQGFDLKTFRSFLWVFIYNSKQNLFIELFQKLEECLSQTQDTRVCSTAVLDNELQEIRPYF